jgi:CRISPR-associated protein Cas2
MAMLVMILECVPPALRGELTRWLIEPHVGVFVGHVSALVREKLWWKCVKSQGVGGVMQIWSTNTEQRFAMRKAGDTNRRIADFDGLQLIRIPHDEATKVRLSKTSGEPIKPKRKNGNLRIELPAKTS